MKFARDMITTYSQIHRTHKHSQHSLIIWPVWPNAWVSAHELSGCGFESCCNHLTSYIMPFSSKDFLNIQANKKYKVTLKCVCDMISTYSQMHRTDMQPQHSSIFRPVWPNSWVFVYELSGFGLKFCCSHLNISNRTCFNQGFPWHSGKYSVWIHSQIHTGDDNNMQSNILYRYALATKFNNLASLAKCLSVFYYLSGCRLESHCSHLNFRYHACFE